MLWAFVRYPNGAVMVVPSEMALPHLGECDKMLVTENKDEAMEELTRELIHLGYCQEVSERQLEDF